MHNFFCQSYSDLDEAYSLIIDDDGRVAYAYLLENKEIVGDVWLYNRELAPDAVDWEEGYLPYINPSAFIKTDIVDAVQNETEVNLIWAVKNDMMEVKIFIREVLFACVKPGDFPGFSTMVIKDGPLAKVYEWP